MTVVRCAQCAQSFEAQAWTRTCPGCGTQNAGLCTRCNIPVGLPAIACDLHAVLAAAPATVATGTWADAPPYQRPAWPPATAPVGDLLPSSLPRRRRWPLALLALVVLGAAVGGGLVASTKLTDKPYPKKWDPRVTDLVAFVERERGLEFDHPVYVDFLSDAAFRSGLTEHDALSPEEEAEVDRQAALLRAVGLLHGDVDLEAMFEELVGDGVVGQYRFDDQRVSVRGETLDDESRATLVHELTHALQDQNFKIAKFEAANSGGDLAFTAVVEADADNVQAAWEETLSDEARDALYEAQDDTAGDADFEGVDPVFIELMSFPYAFGPTLLDAVIAREGMAGRNGLFTRPPLSEEQIILPDAYVDDQAIADVKTPELAAGEKVVPDSGGDFGMVSLLVVLGERINYEVAWKAVQGWAGDAVIGFERDGKTCARIDVQFDEASQAERFEAAVAQWGKGLPTSHSRNGRTTRVESCDPGTEAPGRAEGHISGIQGLGMRGALKQQLTEGGWAEDKAPCVADNIIELLTVDRFIELDNTEKPTKAAVAEIERVTARWLLK